MKHIVTAHRAAVFILAAAVLMILIDLVVLHVIKSGPGEDISRLPVVDSSVFVHNEVTHSEVADFESSLPKAVPQRHAYGPLLPPEPYTVERLTEKAPTPVVPPVVVETPSILRKEGEPAKIVIIIDDMGMDRRRSREVIGLPGELTLAFLPYAPGLPEMTGEARTKGHELLIHMPMEPMDPHLNTGPIALKTGMSAEEFNAMLEKAFASFDGYAGMNNHMGSRMTSDEGSMRRVMAALRQRGLLFVDSKTIGSSVASRVAGEYGLRHADRDVFLDHEDNLAAVRGALRRLERVAMKKGYAIAIGHPKDATIAGLKEWLPGLKERGFEIVPVSEVVRQTNNGNVVQAGAVSN